MTRLANGLPTTNLVQVLQVAKTEYQPKDWVGPLRELGSSLNQPAEFTDMNHEVICVFENVHCEQEVCEVDAEG